MPRKQGGGKKKRQLTPRQRALIRNVAAGKSVTKAAVAAGYTSHYPAQAGHQALKQIQHTAPEILARHGLTDDSLIENYLLPLMKADETKFFPLPVGRGKTRQLKISTRNTVAWNARKEGLDMAFKIRGLYVREAENVGPEFSVVIINAQNRPDWAAMRKARPTIAIPDVAPPKE
jgi:hypothetical protein